MLQTDSPPLLATPSAARHEARHSELLHTSMISVCTNDALLCSDQIHFTVARAKLIQNRDELECSASVENTSINFMGSDGYNVVCFCCNTFNFLNSQ